MLKMIVLNRVLLTVHEAMNDARERKTWNEHFRKKISQNLQFKNVRCFSSNSHDIKYFCINFDSACRIKNFDDANFIIVFSNLVELWCEKMKKFLCDDASLIDKWILRETFYDKKMTLKISFFSFDDRKFLKMNYNDDDNQIIFEQSTNVVMIISKRCYSTNVVNSFIIKKRIRINKRTWTNEIKRMIFAWNRMCADEIHIEIIKNVDTITIFKDINSYVRKWIIIETSFETSFDQITN